MNPPTIPLRRPLGDKTNTAINKPPSHIPSKNISQKAEPKQTKLFFNTQTKRLPKPNWRLDQKPADWGIDTIQKENPVMRTPPRVMLEPIQLATGEISPLHLDSALAAGEGFGRNEGLGDEDVERSIREGMSL